eukprot:351204-Chlamydomonas_euryale.AAC.15
MATLNGIDLLADLGLGKAFCLGPATYSLNQTLLQTRVSWKSVGLHLAVVGIAPARVWARGFRNGPVAPLGGVGGVSKYGKNGSVATSGAAVVPGSPTDWSLLRGLCPIL